MARAKKSKPKPKAARGTAQLAKLKAALAAAVAEAAKLKADLETAKKAAEDAKAKHKAELEEARARNPPPSAPPAELAQLQPPPTDALQAQEYAHHALMMMLHDAATDTKISARERRKEMRTIAAAAAKLLPRARIAQAEKRVLEHQAAIDRKASERRGAKLERLKPVAAIATPAPTEEHGEESRP